MQQQPGLDSLPSEDFLQWFASFAIERGNLTNFQLFQPGDFSFLQEGSKDV